MIKLLLKILIGTGAVLAASYLVPGISVATFYSALVVAILLGIINITLKPVLGILTLPINFITLGLFSLVVNALLFWWLGSIVDGFSVAGFLPAFLGSLLVYAVLWIGNKTLA